MVTLETIDNCGPFKVLSPMQAHATASTELKKTGSVLPASAARVIQTWCCVKEWIGVETEGSGLQTARTLSLPPEAKCRLSGAHFNPQTSWNGKQNRYKMHDQNSASQQKWSEMKGKPYNRRGNTIRISTAWHLSYKATTPTFCLLQATWVWKSISPWRWLATLTSWWWIAPDRDPLRNDKMAMDKPHELICYAWRSHGINMTKLSD